VSQHNEVSLLCLGTVMLAPSLLLFKLVFEYIKSLLSKTGS